MTSLAEAGGSWSALQKTAKELYSLLENYPFENPTMIVGVAAEARGRYNATAYNYQQHSGQRHLAAVSGQRGDWRQDLVCHKIKTINSYPILSKIHNKKIITQIVSYYLIQTNILSFRKLYSYLSWFPRRQQRQQQTTKTKISKWHGLLSTLSKTQTTTKEDTHIITMTYYSRTLKWTTLLILLCLTFFLGSFNATMRVLVDQRRRGWDNDWDIVL